VPLAWVLAIPATLIAGDASPLGPDLAWALLCQPMLLFFGLLGSLVASFVVVRSIRKKLWPNALSASLLPIMLLAVAFTAFGFFLLCNHLGNAVNLLITKPEYMAEVKNLPADGRVPPVSE